MRQGSNSRGYTAQNGGVNATQPLFRPAHWAVYQEGKLLAAAAETVLKTAKQDLIVRVSQAYFDVLKSRDTLALVGAQKLAVAEQLASAKRSFAVGTASITDSREAQARYDLVISQEITAATDLQVKSDALDQLVGRSGSTPFGLAAPMELSNATLGDLNTWVAKAEQLHPLIYQARLAGC